MIKSLRLENFKSHKDTLIEFDKINSIIPGDMDYPNSCGKSNILKALKLILFGTDFSDKWIRRKTKEAKVTLTLESGLIVSRSRTKSSQEVRIDYPNGTFKEFKGIKEAVPFIEAATNFRKISIDESTGSEYFNFVWAKDPYFLIDDSAEVIQRKILSFLGISSVESAKVALQRQKREQSKLVELLEANLEGFVNSSKLLSRDFSSIEKRFNILDNLFNQLSNAEDAKKKVNDFNNKIHSVSKYRNVLDLEKLTTKVTKIETLLESLGKIEGDLRTLKKYKQFYLERENTISNIALETEGLVKKEQETKKIIDETLALLGYCPLCRHVVQ